MVIINLFEIKKKSLKLFQIYNFFHFSFFFPEFTKSIIIFRLLLITNNHIASIVGDSVVRSTFQFVVLGNVISNTYADGSASRYEAIFVTTKKYSL